MVAFRGGSLYICDLGNNVVWCYAYDGGGHRQRRTELVRPGTRRRTAAPGFSPDAARGLRRRRAERRGKRGAAVRAARRRRPGLRVPPSGRNVPQRLCQDGRRGVGSVDRDFGLRRDTSQPVEKVGAGLKQRARLASGLRRRRNDGRAEQEQRLPKRRENAARLHVRERAMCRRPTACCCCARGAWGATTRGWRSEYQLAEERQEAR